VSRELALRGAVVAFVAAAAGLAVGAVIHAQGYSSPVWIAIAVISAAAAGAAGFVALLASARDVSAVSAAAGRLSEGELGERVVASSGPVGGLTSAFNSMAVRVQLLFDSIAAEHARLEAVFDASTDPMVALSREAIIRFLNPAAVRLFGTTMIEAVGRPFIETARDYELDAIVRRAIAMPGTGDAGLITFGAARKPLRASAVPIIDGGDWAVLLTLTDLTEVQRTDQVRRDFLSNVSHELRTPLASISALVETLDDVDDSADREEFLRRIRQQVDRLTTLVNELLDLSRIESGVIELRPEQIDVADVVRESASLLRARADAQEVRLLCPDETPPITIEADRASLLRVVSNLLDNAIKYSPKGSTIRVTTADEGELVALSVADEGAGIAAQDRPRVFERFYKGEASRSSAGVGLGLAIVKHLVRAHGGTASVTSEPGEGATFTVRLPKTFVKSRG
jgi:two-component system, OmpR family, phosphate regulon sensor histidine kinase PhoR